MKFRCDSQTLITAIKTVIPALPSKTANPVLDGVLIETGGNMVRLTCCDERMTIVTTISAEVVESGRGVVPGKLFSEVANRLMGGDIEVAMNERFMFTVRGSGSRTNIAGQDAKLYPELPTVNGEYVISMPQDMLKRMIGTTAFAVALEDMREVLTGAYLEFANGNATMVGLDGYRMAVCIAETSSIVDECSAIIPVKAVNDIGKMLSDNPDDFVNLSIGGGKLHVNFGNTDLYAVLIQGNYIGYKGILPKDFSTKVTMNVKTFRDAVERAALIAKQGANNLLVLRITGDEMAIESRSEIGDVHEKVDIYHEGADINIAFNVKYIIDVLRNVNDDEIEMNFTTSASPCTIVPLHESGVTYLVLPVRTSAT